MTDIPAANRGATNQAGADPLNPVIRNAKRTIEEARPTSKPDRGLVLTRWDVYNQRDEHVMMMRGYGLFARRPAE